MEIKDFPLCCGIKVLVDFGHTVCTEGSNMNRSTAHPDFYAPTEEEITDFITRIKDLYKPAGYSMLMATLNQAQKDKIGDVLIKNGFKMLQSASNPKHDRSIIYLYVRVLNL